MANPINTTFCRLIMQFGRLNFSEAEMLSIFESVYLGILMSQVTNNKSVKTI